MTEIFNRWFFRSYKKHFILNGQFHSQFITNAKHFGTNLFVYNITPVLHSFVNHPLLQENAG